MELDVNPEFLLKGLVIGFSIAAPVGPIGVLCIRRTLAGGFLPGVTAGLGAATADAVYGAIAAFGLTAVTSFLVGQRVMLGIIGGAFLIMLGLRVFFARPAPTGERADTPNGANGDRGANLAGGAPAGVTDPPIGAGKGRAGAGGGYLSTFFLTITNPMTILFFVAVFAGGGLATAPKGYGSALLLVTGVFAGSALWWLTLSTATGIVRKMITPTVMRAVNYLAGVVIAGFGVYSIWAVV
jgi:threonine/homoserine/homoserine lactone efflux protein